MDEIKTKINIISSEHLRQEFAVFGLLKRRIKKWLFGNRKPNDTQMIFNIFVGLTNIFETETFIETISTKFDVDERAVVLSIIKYNTNSSKISYHYNKKFFDELLELN